MSEPLRAPYAVAHGWCGAWDGNELVCDLPPEHDPGAVRTHRGHVQINGRGPFRVVHFDTQAGGREPWLEPIPTDAEQLTTATAAELPATEATAWGCTAHDPVQHRDRRPPWCGLCGRTADGSSPETPPDPPAKPLPPPQTRVREQSRSGKAGTVVGHDEQRATHVLVTWDTDTPGWAPRSVKASELNVLPFTGTGRG